MPPTHPTSAHCKRINSHNQLSTYTENYSCLWQRIGREPRVSTLSTILPNEISKIGLSCSSFSLRCICDNIMHTQCINLIDSDCCSAAWRVKKNIRKNYVLDKTLLFFSSLYWYCRRPYVLFCDCVMMCTSSRSAVLYINTHTHTKSICDFRRR